MIRIANLEDLTAIDSIGTLIKDNFSKQNHTRERINLDYVKIFVYEDQSIIKGFIEIECHYETTDLINIAVLKKYQNQGIASSLLNYVIENINQQNIILEVNENNIKAIKFYQRNNFKEINRRNKYHDTLYDAIVVMKQVFL